MPLTAEAVSEPHRDRADGRRTVAVPLPAGALPAAAGDRVDVWAVLDPTLTADGEQRAARVADDAEVVGATDAGVVLAVEPEDVEPTAAASVGATAVLVGSS
jgi:hypothetical protein